MGYPLAYYYSPRCDLIKIWAVDLQQPRFVPQRGRNNSAQGSALGKGRCSAQALKGRHSGRAPSAQGADPYSALSGLPDSCGLRTQGAAR